MHLSRRVLQELVERFLEEDIGFGDITTLSVVPETAHGHGRLIAKAPLVLAGLEVAQAAFQVVDARVLRNRHLGAADEHQIDAARKHRGVALIVFE